MLGTVWMGALALFAVFFAMPLQARAYIDPATSTYVIQIVSALVITLGVTIGVFFGRIRMFFLNARVKLAEWRIKLFSKKQEVALPAYARYVSAVSAQPMGKWAALWHDERSFFQRLLTALIMSLAIAFTFIAFGPFELYALNINWFQFALTDIYGLLLLAALAATLGLTVVLSILRGKPFDLLLSLLCGILLAGYLQGNFFNNTLGQLTGDFIAWHQHGSEFVSNFVVWLGILLLPFLLYYFSKKAWAFVMRAFPLLLIAVQLVSMVSLGGDLLKHQPDMERFVSTKGLYQVSSKDNIIVIILDRLDNINIDELLQQAPDFFAPMDGFTRYDDHVTLYTQTFAAVPNMLTNKVHRFEQSDRDYLHEAFTTSTFLPELREHGYRVKLYIEPGYSFSTVSDLEGVADNIETATLHVHKAQAAREFVLLSMFRYTPIALKPFFWITTDRFSHVVDINADPPPYVTNDAHFYRQLTTQRLSVDDSEKSFSYIHLNGPHAPFTINEEAQEVLPHEGTFMGQLKGSFRIVYEYLDQLKALGKYEDATIIVMADHGSRWNDILPPEHAITGALFIKPKGSANTPIKVSAAPVSTDNFAATIYQAAGLPHAQLGKSYLEVQEGDTHPRYTYHRLMASDRGPSRLLVYEISGYSRDFSNWHLKEDVVLQH